MIRLIHIVAYRIESIGRSAHTNDNHIQKKNVLFGKCIVESYCAHRDVAEHAIITAILENRNLILILQILNKVKAHNFAIYSWLRTENGQY